METLAENKLQSLFNRKQSNLLNVYFTAGFPELMDTSKIIELLAKNGVDMIEVGIPYSDPLADGPVIQNSGQVALKNGMTLSLLLDQLKAVEVEVPLILMGYFNQLLQFGVERFCKKCVEAGVSGLIIPDLPLSVFEQKYKALFDRHGLSVVFLITPQTSDERIKKVDELSSGFIYMVSDASITGGNKKINMDQMKYFQRIESMQLTNPRLIGFGISSADSLKQACAHANGAIIGSAFIKALQGDQSLDEKISGFIRRIRQ